MNKSAMYLRMISRALLKRKSRVAIALAALIIGTGVISGLISVYYDINIKMSKELRSYGANFVMVPGENELVEAPVIDKALETIGQDKLVGYSPYLYGVVEAKERKLVLVGSRLDQIEKVTPYWEITGGRTFGQDDKNSLLVGYNVAKKLDIKVGDSITITGEKTRQNRELQIKGIVRTGSSEDNQLFVELSIAQQLLDMPGKASLVYFSLLGKSQELTSLAAKINTEITGAEIQPIKQISESEGKILEKIKSLVYLVVLVILLSTLLCVSTTMMTMVIERRKEIGLRKALGAQNGSIVKEFLGEGVLLGLTGGLIGAFFGLGLAQLIGQSVFNSYISLRMEVVVLVTVMSLLVAAIASVLPVRTATNVEPALTLKGE